MKTLLKNITDINLLNEIESSGCENLKTRYKSFVLKRKSLLETIDDLEDDVTERSYLLSATIKNGKTFQKVWTDANSSSLRALQALTACINQTGGECILEEQRSSDADKVRSLARERLNRNIKRRKVHAEKLEKLFEDLGTAHKKCRELESLIAMYTKKIKQSCAEPWPWNL